MQHTFPGTTHNILLPLRRSFYINSVKLTQIRTFSLFLQNESASGLPDYSKQEPLWITNENCGM